MKTIQTTRRGRQDAGGTAGGTPALRAAALWLCLVATGCGQGAVRVDASGALLYPSAATFKSANSITSGTGTVTSVSVTTANGVSGSVATATTTPALTLSLGEITPTGININAGALVLAGDGIATVNPMVFYASSEDEDPAISIGNVSGTKAFLDLDGNMYLDGYLTVFGLTQLADVAVGGAFTVGGKTLTLGGALTTTGTSAITLAFPSGGTSTYTFPTSTATLARTDAAQTFAGTQSFGLITVAGGSAAARVDAITVTGTVTGDNSLAMKLTNAGGGGAGYDAYNSSGDDASFSCRGSSSGTYGAIPPGRCGGFYFNGTGPLFFMGDNASAYIAFAAGGNALCVRMNAASTASTSTTTGTLVVTGGTGISGALYAGSDVVCSTAGKGLQLKSGTGARAGNATLVAGTVTVTNASVTANTIVMLTRKTAGGTLGNLTYTLSAGASFTITSDSATDTSVVSFLLIELN